MSLKPWPWNMLAEPTPADWGIGMTVCISAHSVTAMAFVLASDTMVSTGDMSAEAAAFKFYAFGTQWMAQFAGNDISPVTPIVRDVSRALDGKPETLENVVNAFQGAFRRQLQIKSEIGILGPLGYSSVEEFRTTGLAQLGPDLFSRAMIEMQQQELDLVFLVSGVDSAFSRPSLFTVRAKGEVSYFSEIGFWAIGSGQTNA